MLIKLRCSNSNCAYSYHITQTELEESGQYHKVCLICGSKIEVANLDEIVKDDLYKRAEEYINKWVREMGWDRTLDLIKRNSEQSCYKIYIDILRKKGFKI